MTNTVPPEDPASADLTAEMIGTEIGRATESLTDLGEQVTKLEYALGTARAQFAQWERHLRTLESVRSLLSGRFQPLAPRDVVVRDGVLGLQVGALHLGPESEGDAGALRLYAAVMRSLYQEATSQATWADQAAKALEHRAGQAAVETGAHELPTPPPSWPAEREPDLRALADLRAMAEATVPDEPASTAMWLEAAPGGWVCATPALPGEPGVVTHTRGRVCGKPLVAQACPTHDTHWPDEPAPPGTAEHPVGCGCGCEGLSDAEMAELANRLPGTEGSEA
jgi:hypothetical protein